MDAMTSVPKESIEASPLLPLHFCLSSYYFHPSLSALKYTFHEIVRHCWSHSSLYNSWHLAQCHVHEEPSVGVCVCVCVRARMHSVAQSCLTLCYHMDHSLPGSSVMGFSQQEYWIGLPFPSPGHLLDPGIEPTSPALQADSLPSAPAGKPHLMWTKVYFSLGQPMGRLQIHLHHRPGTHLDVVLEGSV